MSRRSWVQASGTATRPPSSSKVVIGREGSRLVGVRKALTLEESVAAGRLHRRKVERLWLYAAAERDIDLAQAHVLNEALVLCRSWLLSSMRPLAGKIAKDSAGVATMEAVRPILRMHVRSGRLGGLAALTAEYEPHMLLYDPDDAAELGRIIGTAEQILREHGVVSVDELPEPSTPRGFRAWRYQVLSHLEWAGHGSLVGPTLTAWGER